MGKEFLLGRLEAAVFSPVTIFYYQITNKKRENVNHYYLYYFSLLPDWNFYTGKAFDFPRLVLVYRSQSLFVHCPYKVRINRAKGVLTGLKPY